MQETHRAKMEAAWHSMTRQRHRAMCEAKVRLEKASKDMFGTMRAKQARAEAER